MGVVLPVVLSMIFVLVVYRLGFRMIANFSRMVPPPPPPGELRTVKLTFRCSSCGTEVRMTKAPNQAPEPPRCCMDEMDLLKDHLA